MESDPIRITVDLWYDTDNTAPYPETKTKSFMVDQGSKFKRAIGTIIDDEGDAFYLDRYSISYEKPLPWIILKN